MQDEGLQDTPDDPDIASSLLQSHVALPDTDPENEQPEMEVLHGEDNGQGDLDANYYFNGIKTHTQDDNWYKVIGGQRVQAGGKPFQYLFGDFQHGIQIDRSFSQVFEEGKMRIALINSGGRCNLQSPVSVLRKALALPSEDLLDLVVITEAHLTTDIQSSNRSILKKQKKKYSSVLVTSTPGSTTATQWENTQEAENETPEDDGITLKCNVAGIIFLFNRRMITEDAEKDIRIQGAMAGRLLHIQIPMKDGTPLHIIAVYGVANSRDKHLRQMLAVEVTSRMNTYKDQKIIFLGDLNAAELPKHRHGGVLRQTDKDTFSLTSVLREHSYVHALNKCHPNHEVFDYGPNGNKISLISGIWLNTTIAEEVDVEEYAVAEDYAGLSSTHRPILALLRWNKSIATGEHPISNTTSLNNDVEMPLLYSVKPGPMRNSLSIDQRELLGKHVKERIQEDESMNQSFFRYMPQKMKEWSNIIKASVTLGINLPETNDSFIDKELIKKSAQEAIATKCRGVNAKAKAQIREDVTRQKDVLHEVLQDSGPNFHYHREKTTVETTFGDIYAAMTDIIYQTYVDLHKP